jgi:hypothetical protein
MRRLKRGWRYGWFMIGVALPAATYGGSAPLVHHTFEEGVSGWTAMGTNSKVALTREAAYVKEGKAALQFDYAVGKGEMGALMLPTSDGALAKTKSFHFWVRADHTTTLAVALQEKQGGRYSALFMAPKDGWQQVELALSDFILGEGKDDPKDPDNQLDLDQVEGVGITDLAQVFAQIEDDTLRELLGGQPGSHTLYLDDFAVSDEALPEAATAADGEVRLDRFDRPQLQWLAVGDVLLSAVRGAGLGEARAESGLKAEYRQGPGKIAGLVRHLPHGKLSGMERVMLDVASARPTEIVVQVEEKSGGKYNKQVSIPGDSKVQKLSLAFSEFTASGDSKDDNARLDLDQVTQILILDLSGFTGVEEGDNTLRVSNLRAAPAKASR